MTIRTSAFLQLPADGIIAHEWQWWGGSEWIDLPMALPSWDYATAISLRRLIQADLKLIRELCRLPASAELGVSVIWHSSTTNRRDELVTQPLASEMIAIGAELAGEELGGTLNLRTRIILLERAEQTYAISATTPGSILWEDLRAVVLEGESSMFPVEVVDFAKAGIDEKAAWYLEADFSDPERPTLGVMRLLLNEGNRMVLDSSLRPDASEGSKAIVSAMRYDVLRQLVDAALECDWYDDSASYAHGTIGSLVRSALFLGFGISPKETVKALRHDDPSGFATRIQHAVRLFHV